jgi:glycerate kinase
VPYGVATVAAQALRPCVALAGQVLVGSREMRALGIESAYSLVDLVGEERAFAAPAEALADAAERVARTWGRQPGG